MNSPLLGRAGGRPVTALSRTPPLRRLCFLLVLDRTPVCPGSSVAQKTQSSLGGVRPARSSAAYGWGACPAAALPAVPLAALPASVRACSGSDACHPFKHSLLRKTRPLPSSEAAGTSQSRCLPQPGTAPRQPSREVEARVPAPPARPHPTVRCWAHAYASALVTHVTSPQNPSAALKVQTFMHGGHWRSL